jgi:hypothetical protein
MSCSKYVLQQVCPLDKCVSTANNAWSNIALLLSQGENGYFRIQMHSDNLAIEKEGDWGVPTTTKP